MIERGEKIPSLETFITLLNTLDASADIVLSDVSINGYVIKDSILNEKILMLSESDKILIYDLINTIIKYFDK